MEFKHLTVIYMQEDVQKHVKHAKKLLYRTFNCSESQIIPLQIAENIDNDLILKSVIGLAGGVYNHGSTCGVIFGTAINYALRLYKIKENWSVADEISLNKNINDYITWFKNKYGSTLCRDRTELDFTTIKGKLGLLIPEKAKGCISQTAKSMIYQFEHKYQNLDSVKLDIEPKYCARDTLDKIYKNTGVGDNVIRQLSVVLDGGIAYSGNACGALVAGIMMLGLKFGVDHTKNDVESFKHLFRYNPSSFTKPANKLIEQFKQQFGTLECSGICNREFDGWIDFQEYRKNSCDNLINFVSNLTTQLIGERNIS